MRYISIVISCLVFCDTFYGFPKERMQGQVDGVQSSWCYLTLKTIVIDSQSKSHYRPPLLASFGEAGATRSSNLFEGELGAVSLPFDGSRSPFPFSDETGLPISSSIL